MLKIAEFGGKFLQGSGEASPVVSDTRTVAAGAKTNTYKAEPPHSFKLKMAMAEAKEDLREQQNGDKNQPDVNKVKSQTEFTLADVSAALEAYIGTLQEDTAAVKIALTSHAPKVQGFVITLEVDNDFLLAKVMDLHPYLLSFLSKKLDNGFITLNAQVYTEPADGQDNKRLFTAKDKFEHFVSINPAVGELKALFGLEIE